MAYERLTKKINGKNYIETPVDGMHDYPFMSHRDGKYQYTTGKAIDRLAELEDMIESGLLVERPCKFGESVYFLTIQGEIVESVVEFMILRHNAGAFDWYINGGKLGTNVFTTKEAAEAKLK